MRFDIRRPEITLGLWFLGGAFGFFVGSIVLWSNGDVSGGVIFELVGVIFFLIGALAIIYNSMKVRDGTYKDVPETNLDMLIIFLFVFTILLLVASTIVIAVV